MKFKNQLTVKPKTIVIHSGGMDSSLCLALAIEEFSKSEVIGLSFTYGQRHAPELHQAEKICKNWGVAHVVVNADCLQSITDNALMNPSLEIIHPSGKVPNTLVVGRNGLWARLGAIFAAHVGATSIYMGVIGVDGSNSGYRDCSRSYMDKMQEILRLDLDDPSFEIRTPLVTMSKKETMELGYRLGVLGYLLEETITCYEGVSLQGCLKCPACLLRNKGIQEFLLEHPEFPAPYRV